MSTVAEAATDTVRLSTLRHMRPVTPMADAVATAPTTIVRA
jgi:hypothetical protein